jgi:uncharacterized protein
VGKYLVAVEPDMENLLASIRKAIDSDIGDHPPIAAPGSERVSFRGAMRELRVNFSPESSKATSDEIQELRNKINRTRNENPGAEPAKRYPPLPPISSPSSVFAGIMGADKQAKPAAQRAAPEPPSFRTNIAERPAEPFGYEEADYEEPVAYQDETGWPGGADGNLPAVAEAQGYQNYSADPLLSDYAAETANSAFNQLADTVMARALGERSIEDMTHDLLKGMLKTWLDNNLPSLVERMVREEIERVARRGR